MVENRKGSGPSKARKSIGLTGFDAITLERGLTEDPSFENWANLVWQYGGGMESDIILDQFRKNISIELYNEAGQLMRAYKVYHCWPTQYQAISALDANQVAVIIERLTLENEGWERDRSVIPPAQT